ncbi:MAG: polysaccharide biosynthesis/export family protein [Candidatus Omnitrophota bacterium]|nr:MAG: polysaccharide biosynthesis/export family protein [Candidatus Omnitrophota bacterium]
MRKCLLFLFVVFVMATFSYAYAQSPSIIRIGDVVDINVYGEPHLNAKLKVSQYGTIHYLRVGKIEVAGLGSEELARKIESLLRKHYLYLRAPQVTVLVSREEPYYPEEPRYELPRYEEPARYYEDMPRYEEKPYYPKVSRPGYRVSDVSSRREYTFARDVRPTYQIAPGDRLAVSVYGEPGFDREVRVSERGTILYPPLGEVYVEGLAVEEATRKLEGLLGKDYFVDPKVSVDIVEYGKFYVQGEVDAPGSFELRGSLSLVDALVYAGGPTEKAELSHVKVFRTYGEAGEKEFSVDLSREGANFFLKPMDRIMVEPRGKIYIIGAVASPGNYHITRETKTLQDALSFLAGGPKESANVSAIEVVRKEAGRDKTYTLDLAIHSDFPLKELDRITVKELGTISVFGEVRSPGRYHLKEELTVVELIALAGGFTEDAAQNAVKVIRREGKTFRVPVASILSSGDMSRDVKLKDGDTVIIPESWF